MRPRLRRTAITLTASAALMLGCLAPATVAPATAAPDPSPTRATGSDAQCVDQPQYFAYYRTWRDKFASWPGSDPTLNSQRMDDLPRGVDVAFVFDNYVSSDSEFWDVLREEYVPNLHAQGTQLVRTIGIEKILDAPAEDTPEAYQEAADAILEQYVTKYGLDGLDVDMERELTSEQVDRVAGVFEALSQRIGPLSGTDKLFIYDTNQPGSHPLTPRIAPFVSYTLIQSYGRSLDGLQATRDSYAPYFHPCQYFIGFSFYEERGHDWGDAEPPMESSRAYQYALWQPDGETKGGIFSYAVERDGKLAGDDTISRSDFAWSKMLINTQNAAADRTTPPPPAPEAKLNRSGKRLTGTGVPHAEVTVTVQPGRPGRSQVTSTTTAAADGSWSVKTAGVRPVDTVRVRQAWWDSEPSEALTIRGRG